MKTTLPLLLIIFTLFSCIQNPGEQPQGLNHRYSIEITGAPYTQSFSGEIPNLELITILVINNQQTNQSRAEIRIDTDDYTIDFNLAFNQTEILPLGRITGNMFSTSNIKVLLKNNDNVTLDSFEGSFTVSNVQITQLDFDRGLLTGNFNFTGRMAVMNQNQEDEILLAGQLILSEL
ncbi:hypothetical protein SAMN06295967_11082 [Belliella buryatensis]|uniref:Uncharacterized protein n=1 Tax=Belliella buryatensis TaxID=1500549 RepID=A0A239EQX8_9BACT|nr:hypothetical protein [Belliella buryatensis]SNS47160.1 hypothetical protein SAMN06295967_11082 [Belliella buryatensis]